MTREKPAYKIKPLDFVPVYGLVRYIGRNMNSDEEFAQSTESDINAIYPNFEEFFPRALALGTYHFATTLVATIAGAGATGLTNLIQNS